MVRWHLNWGLGVLHWIFNRVETYVCVCVCVWVCARCEEVSLALPDESPDGKHNYLPHCLPIISVEEVQVSQLKPWTIGGGRLLESDVPWVEPNDVARFLQQLSAGRRAPDPIWVVWACLLSHPTSTGQHWGQRWEQEEEEKGRGVNALTLGVGDGQSQDGGADWVNLADPLAVAQRRVGWSVGRWGGGAHLCPRRLLCLLKLTCGGKSLSWPSDQTGNKMSTTAQEVFTQDLRRDVLSQGSDRKAEMCSRVWLFQLGGGGVHSDSRLRHV